MFFVKRSSYFSLTLAAAGLGQGVAAGVVCAGQGCCRGQAALTTVGAS